MKPTTRLATLAATLAAAAALAPIAPASANVATRTRMPGLACQIGWGEGSVKYGDDGTLFSEATAWRTAVCPITYPGGLLLSARADVSVIDMSYDSDVQCRLILSAPLGWTTWGPTVTSQGTSTSPQTLIVTNLAQLQDASGFVHCYLPAIYSGHHSAIASYSTTMATY